MGEAEVIQQVVRNMERLSPELQRKVLRFTEELSGSRPKGTPGKELLRFAGTLSPEAAKEMMDVIEAECGQVDPDGW
jgi:hypothetical protein